TDRSGAFRVEIFRRFALDEQSIGPDIEDRMHGEDVGLHQMLERSDECGVVAEFLVPPAPARRERGANEHLVDRRIKLDPRISRREIGGISLEKFWEVRV